MEFHIPTFASIFQLFHSIFHIHKLQIPNFENGHLGQYRTTNDLFQFHIPNYGLGLGLGLGVRFDLVISMTPPASSDDWAVWYGGQRQCTGRRTSTYSPFLHNPCAELAFGLFFYEGKKKKNY